MKKNKYYLYLLPGLLMIMFFFIYPLLLGVSQSFGLNTLVGDNAFRLDYYAEVLSRKDFARASFYTIKVSTLGTLGSLLISIAIIYYFYANMSKNTLGSRILKKVISLPLLVPYLIASYLILLLLSEGGVIFDILIKLNLLKDSSKFWILTNDEYGYGVIITYIWKTIPFYLLMTLPILERIKSKWEDLRVMLGLSTWGFFKEVVLPLLIPALTISSLIIFAYMFSSFEVPYILGNTNNKALSILAYEIYSGGELFERPQAIVINVIISSVCLLGGLLVLILNKYFEDKTGGWE